MRSPSGKLAANQNNCLGRMKHCFRVTPNDGGCKHDLFFSYICLALCLNGELLFNK